MRQRGSSNIGSSGSSSLRPWHGFSKNLKGRKKKHGHATAKPRDQAPDPADVRDAAQESLRSLDTAGEIREVDVPRQSEAIRRATSSSMMCGRAAPTSWRSGLRMAAFTASESFSGR